LFVRDGIQNGFENPQGGHRAAKFIAQILGSTVMTVRRVWEESPLIQMEKITCGKSVKSETQLWWDYSEGWSKCESSCLNFDLGKKVKMSRVLPYKVIHVIF
jgi:hypothetical protein